MWVAIAEKSSQAEKIASALNLRKQGGLYSGFYKGQELILWYAAGHFLELSPPTEQIQNFSWNDPRTHERIPRKVPYKVCPDIPARDGYPARKPGERIQLLKQYVDKATLVIGATDPDREGEVIYRSILDFLKYDGPLKRVWLTKGLSKDAIQTSFDEMVDASQYYGEYLAGSSRRMADYAAMVLTATYTYYSRRGMLGKYLGSGDKKSSTTSVGRVQSTVVGFTYHRHQERANFKSVTHFRPVPLIRCNGAVSFEGRYLPEIKDSDYDSPIPGVKWDEKNLASKISPDMSEEEVEELTINNRPKPLYIDKSIMMDFTERLKQACILDLDINESMATSAPPKPLSLTKLQSLISNASATDVLNAAQRLYDSGFITYPRGEEQEISDKDYNPRDIADKCTQLAKWDQFGQAALKIAAIQTGQDDTCASFKPSCYTPGDKIHDALAPVVIPKPGELQGLDLQVFEEITSHYLQAHLPPSKYLVQEGVLKFDTHGLFGEPVSSFKITKRSCIETGWEHYFKGKETVQTISLNDLDKSNVSIPDVELKESTTTKPPLFTEASLLFAMYHAAKFEPNPILRNSLKESKGIGTPATRPTQIATILMREFVAYTSKGKNPSIDITPKGIELYKALPDSYKSPGTTAKWELKLSDMSKLPQREAEAASLEFINTQIENTEKLIGFLNKNLFDKTPRDGVNPNMPLSNQTKDKLQKRCKGLGLPMPRQALASEAKARQWLREHPWLVTDAMRRKISQICSFKKIQPPALKMTDFGKALEFIKVHEDDVPSTPSKKFLDYAKQLESKTGLKIPSQAISNAKLLSKYVEEAKRIKKPSKKTIAAINELAKKLNVRVPASELENDERAKNILSRMKAMIATASK
ncbi:DNA topoisomerase [Vibrio parahaemolyticus]|uniref:DNA topoisomerase n=8 Tax=Vibrio TaxID=662 RepID=A0AA47JMJ6_VIBPH|nr:MULTISPECIES: DNA topoisomerase [Vibrio]EJG1066088.1 hypothetical protein [Vibrio parahaemolyticus O1]MDW1807411.1 DNA topoisomerase [Vibrio sp. Vb2362]MDW2296430.1 DNA topoisomerase [Vibrio sp. 1404]APX09775.1 hypothetical protein BWP24_26550 [Vibrio campbellii]ARR10142.1 hypothetical protein Vc3S01_p20027 [Vibrio campbellii]